MRLSILDGTIPRFELRSRLNNFLVLILGSVTFDKAITILSDVLTAQNPKSFSGTWVYQNAPRAYRFFRLNLRTPTGNIDWDSVTDVLDRSHQYKWDGRKRKAKKPYENQTEVDLVLAKYHNKIYTCITAMSEQDRRTRDRILIALVRVAQRGNVLARQEAVTFIRFSVDDWIEKYYVLQKWNGFGEILKKKSPPASVGIGLPAPFGIRFQNA